MLSAPPLYSPLAEPEDPRHAGRLPRLMINLDWFKWLADAIVPGIDKAPSRQAKVKLTAQGAAIGTTALPLGTIPPGIWRISYYFRVTQAASTSSSVTFTLAWTDGIALSKSGAAEAGNTTATLQFGTLVIRVDNATPISYSTAYSSVGATPMLYKLDVIAERLALD